MAGLVNPLVAAIAMPLSSLFVVASSVAQQSFERRSSEVADPVVRLPKDTGGQVVDLRSPETVLVS